MSRINWNSFKYTESDLREAVKNNRSARASMLAVGICGEGAGYKPFMRLVRLLNLDTSHWIGRAYLRGQKHNYRPATPLSEVLCQNSSISSYKLKHRLIKAGLLMNQCSECGINTWQNKALSLHLDHINGQSQDNRLENLRLLCPNCHSQTETYGGKNKKLKRSSRT